MSGNFFQKHCAVRLVALLLGLMTSRSSAQFGVVDEGKALRVDSGAGLVIKLRKDNGDIVSLRYKDGPELQDSHRGSHIASGLRSAKVTWAVLRDDVIKVTLSTNKENPVVSNLTQYLVIRRGINAIYLATFPTAEPTVGELRWITRLDASRFPNRPAPSDRREVTKTIESADVFGCEDGTTRSKYYGDAVTLGKERAMDMTFCGVSGEGIGVWMAYGTRESSSGGPFFRDIQSQTTEVYNYMNSRHNMTEVPRLNVLHGPYALVFTDGKVPTSTVDFSWLGEAGLDLKGYVPESARGRVSGRTKGIRAGIQGVVGFSNSKAQYWAAIGAEGTFTSPPMKPGNYAANFYQGELSVGTGEVEVVAGKTSELNMSAEPDPSALFRIGRWDGTPLEFLNGNRIVMMHPSDVRMDSWGSVVFDAGRDAAAKFPALQMRKVNSPTTIKFTLSSNQIAARILRIGVTCGYGGARPFIKVNKWRPRKVADAVLQPSSRSYTIGTYRGNNGTFIYRIPSSAFVAGVNTLTIAAGSGSQDLSSWLSAGWAYDAIQLDEAPAS